MEEIRELMYFRDDYVHVCMFGVMSILSMLLELCVYVCAMCSRDLYSCLKFENVMLWLYSYMHKLV